MIFKIFCPASQGKHCCVEWQTKTIGTVSVSMETDLSIWMVPIQESQPKACKGMLVSNPLLVSTHYCTNTAEQIEKGKQWGLPIIAMVIQVPSNLHWWKFKKTCKTDIDQNQVTKISSLQRRIMISSMELKYMSCLVSRVAVFLYVKS